MTRIKMESGPVLQNWNEVDATVRRIGQLQLQRENIEAELTKTVDKLQAAAKADCQDIDLEIKNLSHAAKAFTEAHRGEFAPAQARVLAFGTVGFRKATSIAIADVAEALAAAKARGLSWIINVKETLNKEAMHNMPDAELYQIGGRRSTVERFFVEPNRESIAETV